MSLLRKHTHPPEKVCCGLSYTPPKGNSWSGIDGFRHYLTSVSENETQVIIAVLLELINCAAVVGIAVMLFPILKEYREALALGYVGFRVVEAVVLAVGVLSPLVLVTLSHEYVAAGASDASSFQTWGTLAMEARAQLAGLLTPLFFALGAVLLYSYVYQSKLVPRFISVWGLIAVALVLVWNLLETFGISVPAGMAFGPPIILNEVFLGIWLIVRGFNATAIAPQSAKGS